MKKILLLSALMLTANIAAASNVDPCYDLHGNWFGTGGLNGKGSIGVSKNYYNNQNSQFFLDGLYGGSASGSLTGECHNGILRGDDVDGVSGIGGTINNGEVSISYRSWDGSIFTYTLYKGNSPGPPAKKE